MTVLTDAVRAAVADELEAPGSELCDCDPAGNPPRSPRTGARMAHHCECRAVLTSVAVRRGVTPTRHRLACGGHDWEEPVVVWP